MISCICGLQVVSDSERFACFACKQTVDGSTDELRKDGNGAFQGNGLGLKGETALLTNSCY